MLRSREWEIVAMLEGFIDVSVMLRPGVYALLRGGVVVYVGQSKKLLGRIYAHRTNHGRSGMPKWMPASLKGIAFDEVHVLPCAIEELDRLERALIDLYKPRHNIAHKTPAPTTTALTLTVNGVTVPFNQRAPAPRFERRL